ncbi:MAG: alpha-glucan family phosphorylase [Desulfovibrio sp.]
MTKDYLFEVSWEVCNMVGGIYTVISSKVQEAQKVFGDGYITIGPLLSRNPDFVEENTFPECVEALQRIKDKNIDVRTGYWDIPGQPRTILVNFNGAYSDPNKLLFDFWNDYGVDSMSGAWDYIEPTLFSYATGEVIHEIQKDLDDYNRIFAHFHEWMSGAGVLYLKKHAPEITTVLTTHATMLGRALSGTGVDIYTQLDEIEPVEQARLHNITAKCSMETVSSREADGFLTVSKITRTEAENLLGNKPDIVTPNGFNLDVFTDYVQEKDKAQKLRNKLLDFASLFLREELDPKKTRLIATSGRYEFRNKGIDILIESLQQMEEYLQKNDSPDITLVNLFLVTGGYAGFSSTARRSMKDGQYEIERYEGISTHHLGTPESDPIANGCRDVGLNNQAGKKVKVIFIPVYLDGNDGVLNMEYYDALSGCDLTVFPSFYEPWGYTPLESIAFAVPTMTCDRAGFGQWVQEMYPEGHSAVTVIKRLGAENATASEQLATALKDFLHWDDAEMNRRRSAARALAGQATWKEFYKFYVEAYEMAHTVRNNRLSGLLPDGQEGELASFTGVNTTTPRFRAFAVITELPEQLKRLRELADNLWWVWHKPAQALFARICPDSWKESNNNPVQMIDTIDRSRLAELIQDPDFLSDYAAILDDFDKYMGKQKTADHNGITWENPVVYFSMEFGLHESIATYSGGLGLLAGDHIKSASDLNLPFVGVSLLYKEGYFRQRINKNGEQVAEYVESNFAGMPMNIIQKADGKPMLVTVRMPGREVHAQIWEICVGRAILYLLDTDIVQNNISDRSITGRLYEPSSKGRIEQEIILGVGGVRMLEALQIIPGIYHLNEGHSAFLLLERIRRHMKDDRMEFHAAQEVIRGSTVFTMHTPVPAGNERFEKSLVHNHFTAFLEETGLSWDAIWNLGHLYSSNDNEFNMTVLALRLSCGRNGVSKLHGYVSRKMWQSLWTGFILDELPVGYVTNGVHAQSWLDEKIRHLVEESCKSDIHKSLLRQDSWAEHIDDIPDDQLWQAHIELKERLYDEIKNSISQQWSREGIPQSSIEKFTDSLNSEALTICFARRFTGYKRPNLIFKDIERIRAIIEEPKRPINLVFAGKAHPADTQGAEYIKEIVELGKQKNFLGKIIFLENFDIRLARLLVSGADVWLNNPIRFLEASGTSGMKAAMNGVPNCSILDGWWDEAYNGQNGWAIGACMVDEHRGKLGGEELNKVDAENLYSVLIEDVVPTFYRRDERGVPVRWVEKMKESMKTGLGDFNTHRMVREYITNYYEPSFRLKNKVEANFNELAQEIGTWKKSIPGRFSTVTIHEIKIKGIQGDAFKLGDKLKITALVDQGQMDTDEILVELIILNGEDESLQATVPMTLTHQEGETVHFRGEYEPHKAGRCRYGVRIIPVHHGLCCKYETRLVRWS